MHRSTSVFISPRNYVTSVFTSHLQPSCPFEKLTLSHNIHHKNPSIIS